MGFYNCPIQPTNRLISINWTTIKKLGGKFVHCLRRISSMYQTQYHNQNRFQNEIFISFQSQSNSENKIN